MLSRAQYFRTLYKSMRDRKRVRRLELKTRLTGSPSGARRYLPLGGEIILGQGIVRGVVRVGLIIRAADRAGTVGRFFVGEDAVDLARAILGALPDHGRRLAADFAGRRLALAELAHIRHRR